jgi:enterochelin esterase-like enzyme/uncharacterized protein YqkB
MEVFMGKRKKWFALLLVFAMLLTSVGKLPIGVQAATRKTVTVGTQKKLEAALKNAQVGEIIISTKSKVTLTIPKTKGSSSKSLVVKAANATIVNNGTFKAITVEDSKKFTENGKGNAIVINEKKASFHVSAKAEVKSLAANGNGAVISVEKNAVIKSATLKGSSTMSLKKGATINKATITGSSAKLTVDKDAVIKALSVKKKGADVNVVANGEVAIDVLAKANITITGTSKNTSVKVDKKAEGTVLKASAAIKLDTKAAIEVTLAEGAENSSLKISEADVKVEVKNDTKKSIKIITTEGPIQVGKGEELKKDADAGNTPTQTPTIKPTETPTVTPTVKPTETPSSGGNSGGNNTGNTAPAPTRVPVDKNGFDTKGRMVAYFGTPKIDGEPDKVWESAEPVTVKDTAGKTDTSVEFRVLWDDYALYVLAKVKDSSLDSSNGSVYEKDSVEIFLDEKNNKTKDYGVDDLHFRVNYKNEQSADNGDLSRFYTSAKIVDDGYIIEARVALTDLSALKNQKVYGLELQVNEAMGGRRITTLQVFDQTGMAYADTGLFGELILAGKTANSVSGLNPYDLMNLIASSKKIMLERYTNGNAVQELIADAEAALKDTKTTQKKIDELYAALNKAVDSLVSDGKDYDDKECRQIPLKYKTTDEYPGTIERVSYTTNTYDDKNEIREKDFLVYLPYGYDAADKSKKYDVLYLLHGYGEDQNTVFGGPGQNTEMMKILDNMIHDGKLEPMIIVTPTYSYKGTYDFSYIGRFHNELVYDIIPLVESKYNTYAESTSEKDLIAAREHRALGGFSMGSMTTWNTLVERVEYFKYYIPVSGAFSNDGGAGEFEGTVEEKTAQYLQSIIREAGYTPNDISIFCATGTEDFASGGMVSLVDAMKKYDDTFLYTANLNKGNFYFINAEGGTHSWNSVNWYLYNVLPDLFNDKKIELEAPSPIEVGEDGLDADNQMVAYFGTPTIDGAIDQVWEKAVIVPAFKVNSSPIEAKFRMLWDDKAIYLLAEVKDSVLDGSSGNVYERDSVEIFFDEKHDRTVSYNEDDLHFRVSYDNKQSADNGDLGRFYTATNIVEGGYIVEARVALTSKPENGTVYGIDLSVNDGQGGRKIAQIGVFDRNNEAYRDTSKFGAIVLTGKAKGAVSGLNPYDLMNVVEEAKEIKLERYSNGDVAQALIAKAEEALKNPEVSQKKVNTLSKKLRAAIDGLIPDGKSYDDKECRMIPKSYRTVDEHKGTIERVSYTTNSYDYRNEVREKDFLVYLPNGYDPEDKETKYNVLYLIHGMGEDQNTVFGGPGQNTEMMKILDNMIYNKQIEPLIVVTPTWSYQGNSGDFSVIFSQTENFHNELVKDIIPKVESMYNVYAESTSEEDLIKAREHRALAGFSMGSSTTWNTLITRVEYFKYYMPMSLSFIKGVNLDVYEGTDDEKRAEYLANVIRSKGYGPNDVSIFCATGTEDMAYGGMVVQVEAMKKVDDIFRYTADLNKGNFYFLTLEGGTHTWNCVNRYLYNMLPDLFNDKRIDEAAIPVRSYVSFDLNNGSGVIGVRQVKEGAVKLPINEVKIPGAELLGWSKTDASTDLSNIITPEVDGTYEIEGNTTLYAVWKWSVPYVAASVSGGAITVDPAAPHSIKLAVSVSGAAIRVADAALSVPEGTVIAGANDDFILNITKSVAANLTSNYIIQYAAVDMNVTDLSSVTWNDIMFSGDNTELVIDRAAYDRRIYFRVNSAADNKILYSVPVLLQVYK